MVYKVVEFQGTARMKFSEEKEKITLPSSKSVLRLYDENDLPVMDLLCLKEEEAELVRSAQKEIQFFKTRAGDCPESTVVPYRIESLTNPLFVSKQTTPIDDRRK